MIKVETINEDGKRIILFEANSENDREMLDEILEAVVGPYPKRGGYLQGQLLKVEVNLKNA